MYNYVAVTKSTIENCTALLRISKEGVIERYDAEKGSWGVALGYGGIYSGDIECETITKKQADYIIEKVMKSDA